MSKSEKVLYDKFVSNDVNKNILIKEKEEEIVIILV